jgi:hypothetical protein
MAKRKAAKRHQAPATAPPSQEPDAGSESVLPMNIQVGDRFTAEGFEWEVLTHPTAMHGAKALRARVVRPGLPETEREVTWEAHKRVTRRRGERREQA